MENNNMKGIRKLTPYITLELSIEGFSELMEYLGHHEDDIALDINDFGDLRVLFKEIMKRAPEKDE